MNSQDKPGLGGSESLDAFRARVRAFGQAHYRDLPWRRTRDPYAIWISEVMLQQTQVARVDGRWQRWLGRFPTVDALASASAADVLAEWQGMGYNRRALSLLKAAQDVSAAGGVMPAGQKELDALPGIGPATAAGIRAFAYDARSTYLETNVRAVFLHELFPDAADVPDKELVPLVEETCPAGEDEPCFDSDDDPRSWYYALLDYGAYLKKAVPNPSRRSRSYARQSRFEGSHRQKRAELVRLLLAQDSAGSTSAQLAAALDEVEKAAGREPVGADAAEALLEELASEGFCHKNGDIWLV